MIVFNERFKRILFGISSNFFNNGITIAIQLISLPVFLHFWTLEQYGVWLLLSTVPAYFSLADGGLVAVTANRMTILSSTGCYKEANICFQSTLFATIVSTFFVLLVTIFVMYFVDFSLVSSFENKLALILLIFTAVITIFTDLNEAVFRACNKYAYGVYAIGAARIIEWIGCLIGLIAYQSMLSAAAGMALGRFIANVILILITSNMFNKFHWSIKESSLNELKLIAKPSLYFLAFPISNIISLQGFSMLVGIIFGPAFLAIFNTYRTLARTLTQLISTVSRTLMPEFSRLFASKNISEIEKLHKKGTFYGVLCCFIVFTFLLYFAPNILNIWTHGKIPYDATFLALLLSSTVITSIWQISAIVLKATNNHKNLSIVYLFSSILCLFFVVLFKDFGKYSIIIGMISFEIIMLISSVFLYNSFVFRNKFQ